MSGRQGVAGTREGGLLGESMWISSGNCGRLVLQGGRRVRWWSCGEGVGWRRELHG